MNYFYLTIILLICTLQVSIAQVSPNESTELKYKRSSLLTMLIDNESFPKRDTVIKAYNNGVEILCLDCNVTEDSLEIKSKVDYKL